MYKAAAIGKIGEIYGFAAAGIDVVPADNAQECAEEFKKACGRGYGVLFITENYAPVINPLIKEPFPAVMYLPSRGEEKGFAARELHDMTKKAVGADLLF